MKYVRNTSTDPHYNMAFDEFCLERLNCDDCVFYLWQNRPSVIIGLNQNAYSEVNLNYLKEHDITLARRVTGGGAVYHDLQNLNYTIVGRSEDLERDYPGYMTYMVNALRSLGVPAEMTGRNDILVDGRKVSGYAKRVYKDRLMVHGTLMFDVDIEELTKALAVPGSKLEAGGIASVRSRVANLKEYLPYLSVNEFQNALEDMLSNGHADSEIVLTAEQLASVEAEAASCFRTWEWNYGKSPMAAFCSKKKFACGTVEARVDVEHGLITALVFGGDFLGNLPSEELAAALVGLRFARPELLAALEKKPIENYFDGLSIDDLVDLILG